MVPSADFMAAESGAVSRDGSLVVSFLPSRADVFALPVITNAAPEWLAELAEALVARRLTSQGIAESIPFVEARNKLDRFRVLEGDDAYAHWARWYLVVGHERAVNPAVHLTQPAYVQLVVASADPQLIRSALELDPDNVKLLEALGRPMISSVLPDLVGMSMTDERTVL